MKRKPDCEQSSGNVFTDLGFRNSKQELLKTKLTVEIYKRLRKRGVTQNEATTPLGTTQAQIPTLMRCRSVSVGRPMEFLNVLGQDVEVTAKPAAWRKAGERYRAYDIGATRAATGARYRCATARVAG